MHIVFEKRESAVAFTRHGVRLPNLPCVDIEPGERQRHATLPQIKCEQTDAAPDVKNRTHARLQRIIRRSKERIGAELAADIVAQPWFPKARRDPLAGEFVIRHRDYGANRLIYQLRSASPKNIQTNAPPARYGPNGNFADQSRFTINIVPMPSRDPQRR